MDRRQFLTLAAATTLPLPGRTQTAPFAPTPSSGWRTFEVTTRVELLKPEGVSLAWIPLPSVDEADWMRPLGNIWQGNGQAAVARDAASGTDMLTVRWEAGEPAPMAEVTSRFATRDRAVRLDAPRGATPLSAAERARYTAATELQPIDGIVKTTADGITRGLTRDIDRARALYDWIVDNTQRNPKTRGCGTGDIRGMLESGNLSGKCADLNALYVGLARAAGLPARDVYGIRVADSRFGYKSLGKSGDITRAQHCRAEVWLSQWGWVPVDPADVRKVVLEERPGLTLVDPLVTAVRAQLFGAWETNWLGYNVAHDLRLPGSAGPTLPFLMYPQAETAAGRLDSLDADGFKYRITSRELTA